MRTDKQIFKRIAITALLVAATATAGIAQDTTTIVEQEAETPVILSTSPSGGETNIDLNGAIEITFSSVMDESTINGTTLVLQATYADTMNDMHGDMGHNQIRDRSPKNESEHSMQYTTGDVSGTISYSDKVALFSPNSELKEGTLYTFTVTNGVKNMENIALENNHSWSFTTTGTTETSFSDNLNSSSGMEIIKTEYSSADTLLNDDLTMIDDDLTMIDLGKAGLYVILAKEAINNESESMITGLTAEGSSSDSTNNDSDSINSALQGDSDMMVVLQSGQRDTASADVSEAIEDMMSAYGDASMQDGDSLTSHQDEQFHTMVLAPGVHEWTDSLHIESNVTLSGSSDDMWLFKTNGDLTVNENTVFTLTNGAQAKNIFWYVEGDVTIGKDAQFEGIILSMNDITLEKGAQLNGRIFSQTSVTLDDNTITEPGLMAGPTSSTNR